MIGNIGRDLKISFGIVALFALIILAFPVSATQFYQGVAFNGTGSVHNVIQNENLITEQIVEVDGVLYMSLSFDDGSQKLIELQNYIAEREGAWVRDVDGITEDDLVDIFNKIAKAKTGENMTVDENEEALLRALDVIIQANLVDFYNSEVYPLAEALNEQGTAIQSTLYETEALYRTLEKDDELKDTYCKSRIEIIKKYGLSSVKCGLHSKQCYNGDIYIQENGRDFCIHTDNDKEYLPCYNVFGRCGSLETLKTYDTEENSYIPVTLEYFNPGTMMLHPTIKVEVEDTYNYQVLKTFEAELSELSENEKQEYVFYFENEGLKPGTYTVRVTVSSGRKEIIDKLDYTVLKEGTLDRTGILEVEYLLPVVEEETAITGAYENTADYPYAVTLNVDMVLNDMSVEKLRSEKVALKPGETKELTVTYVPMSPGSYTMKASISDSDIAVEDSFELLPLSITGQVIRTVKKVPLGQAIADRMNMTENNFPLAAMSIMLLLMMGPYVLIKAFTSRRTGLGEDVDIAFDNMKYYLENRRK